MHEENYVSRQLFFNTSRDTVTTTMDTLNAYTTMHLQKLEIQGFKSFADKITLQFPTWEGDHYGITGVIGPNGSGKSNVADAVRWVLGEQSLKLLRSKRAEDVIFFGSDQKAQKGFCEVSLFFNNEDHTFPLDFAEVVITRRLYRDGASEYILNKNKARLSDIALLLAQAHIGQRSYSVVGQGMIDAILQTAPAERKEFFDEAVGVRQYQIKKDSALNKLKATNEHLAQAGTVLQELEPKMRFFARQLKRLEEREAIDTELRNLFRQYYNCLWNELRDKTDVLAGEREGVQKKIDVLLLHQKEKTALFIQEEKRVGARDVSGFQELQRTLSKLQGSLQSVYTRMSVLDGRLNIDLTQSGKGQLAWLSQKYEEVGQSLQSLRDEIESLTEQSTTIDELEQELRLKMSELKEPESSPSQEGVLQETTRLIEEILEHYEELKKQETSFEDIHEMLGSVVRRLSAMKEKIIDFFNYSQSPHIQDTVRQDRDRLSRELQEILTRASTLRERLRIRTEEKGKNEKEYARIEKEIAYFSSSDMSEQQEALMKEKQELAANRTTLEKEISEVKERLQTVYEDEKEANKNLLELQKEISALQREHEGIQQHATRLDLEIIKLQTHQEELLQKICDDLRVEMGMRDELFQSSETPYSTLGFLKESPPLSLDGARVDIERLKRKLEQIGTIDEDVIKEHEETKQRYEYLTAQVKDLDEAKESLSKAIQELDTIIKERFEKNIEAISVKFTHYFKQLFDGGTARLIIQRADKKEREEGEDGADEEPLDEDGIAGIEIEATPPGKKFKQLSFLSGGEKAMTAIALLCAILAQNPSPFVILDEVDAALDESNANRFAGIIQELSTQTQFILITHNRVTMHVGHVLYGVTMGQDGISRVLSLDIRQLDDIVAK